jgi:hypothetical protein
MLKINSLQINKERISLCFVVAPWRIVAAKPQQRGRARAQGFLFAYPQQNLSLNINHISKD